MKGKFITFEGSEGCGKSTQSKFLCHYLRRRGCPVVYLREPGGTKISEKIRKILLDSKNKAMSCECETLLYMASRAQAASEVILPALRNGKVVISDRFLDSTIAYQGYGLGVNISLIKDIGNFATCGTKPDLTFFLDIPVDKGLAKCGRNKDRIEKRNIAYHRRVRRGYLRLAAQEPKRIKIIRVEPSKAATQAKIRKICLSVI